MPAFGSLIAMVGLIVVPAAAGSVIHVDASAPDDGDGQLWETAFNDLQDAIAAAAPGDELWIAAATYTPAPPGGPREATFALIDDIALYGGFAGFENTLDERDTEVNITILSGDLNGDDDPKDPDTRADNAYHIVEAIDLSEPVTLDGLTLRAANADGTETYDDGGGFYIVNADAVIHDCRVTDNSADGRGAGVVALGLGASQLTVTACRFETNLVPSSSQFSGGAGLMVSGAAAVISGCTFEGNVSGHEAGGLLVISASAIVRTVSSSRTRHSRAVASSRVGVVKWSSTRVSFGRTSRLRAVRRTSWAGECSSRNACSRTTRPTRREERSSLIRAAPPSTPARSTGTVVSGVERSRPRSGMF